MKIKITLITILFALTSIMSSASTTGQVQQIKQNLKSYPEVAAHQNLEGFVLVTIEINQFGKAEIVEINSSHPVFTNHVETKLKEVDLGSQRCLSRENYSFKIKYTSEQSNSN